MKNECNFVIVIKNIKDPNGFSGGMSNKYKGAYKKIFDILDEDSIFVQSEVEDEILKGNDFYLYFNIFPDADKLQRISKIPNVEISNKNFAKGGLIAPNGKPSNLNATQYELVRTPAFKKWFGDWENEPNDNMLVDENGEPLILWHTGGNWTELDESRGNGLMFAFTEDTPAYSAKEKVTRQFFIKSDFIYLVKYEDRHFPQKYKKPTKRKFPVYFVQAFGGFVIVHNSNQIKLADGTNTTFDSDNNDIRFEQGGETKSSTPDYLRMFLGK